MPAAAAESSLPGVESGHRPGPDVLYAPPPRAPQLENTGPWQAEPILVSGASAYREGEFLYQDFIYDDHGAAGAKDPEDPFEPGDFSFSPRAGTLTYPTDEAFANNGADLVELRVTRLADATAFRVTLNTLKDPARTAFTIAIGGVLRAPGLAARRGRALARRAVPDRARRPGRAGRSRKRRRRSRRRPRWRWTSSAARSR